MCFRPPAPGRAPMLLAVVAEPSALSRPSSMLRLFIRRMREAAREAAEACSRAGRKR